MTPTRALSRVLAAAALCISIPAYYALGIALWIHHDATERKRA